MSSTSLHDRMRSLKRRLLAVGLSTSMGWGVAAAVLLLLLGMWLDLMFELAPRARIACGIAGAALGLFMVAGLAISVWRRGAPAALAHRLDRAAAAGGQILAGVDFLLSPVKAVAGGASALTAGLAQLTVDRAATLAARVPSPAAVPAKPIFRPIAALAFLAAAIATLIIAGARAGGDAVGRGSSTPSAIIPPFPASNGTSIRAMRRSFTAAPSTSAPRHAGKRSTASI